MPIPSRPTVLARFSWNLKELPQSAAEMSAPFTLRTAGEQEREEAISLVQASYNLDPEWSGCASHIASTVLPDSIKALAKEPTCLFVQHGNRVIAASIFDPEPEPGGVHLVSGPCVLIEYRNRGIGGALLAATLEALRERGITEVIGQTRPKSPSAKYLCSKFGGTEVRVESPVPEEARANVA
jgi:hypothetical protein